MDDNGLFETMLGNPEVSQNLQTLLVWANLMGYDQNSHGIGFQSLRGLFDPKVLIDPVFVDLLFARNFHFSIYLLAENEWIDESVQIKILDRVVNYFDQSLFIRRFLSNKALTPKVQRRILKKYEDSMDFYCKHFGDAIKNNPNTTKSVLDAIKKWEKAK